MNAYTVFDGTMEAGSANKILVYGWHIHIFDHVCDNMLTRVTHNHHPFILFVLFVVLIACLVLNLFTESYFGYFQDPAFADAIIIGCPGPTRSRRIVLPIILSVCHN